jgi:trehalose synthase
VLERVEVGRQSIEAYASSAGAETVEQLRKLAALLRDVRVLHLNATPYGGGVAEILRSEVPLLRDLGLDAEWRVITGEDDFFTVTKALHNGLQGAEAGLSEEHPRAYLEQSRRNAELLEGDYDLVVAHDPQPLALVAFHGRGDARWIWRCHVDTSEPNPDVWSFVRPYLADYDAAVFTLGGFAPADLESGRVEIIPPAIDPVSPKNMELDRETAERILQWIGVDTERPMVTQVSRFDPWKDPLGVVEAYRLVRDEVPDLQLCLVGSMALDDPEGWEVYRTVKEETEDDDGIQLFTNLTGVGNVEVNAFQRLSDVIVQKSIREGFGLVVSESLWKGTPVVAGRAGGIPLQMPDEGSDLLVDSIEDCADAILGLLREPALAKAMGEAGKGRVRERFLLPRLIADELRLYASVLDRPEGSRAPSLVGFEGEVRDPVCGMRLADEDALREEWDGTAYHFCSEGCRSQFREDPDRYLRTAART